MPIASCLVEVIYLSSGSLTEKNDFLFNSDIVSFLAISDVLP
uniref:Uncharacterized protein n=1 Tax=Arundo donax TaxID=35708 RepID=A0A0A9APV8_ARUDO